MRLITDGVGLGNSSPYFDRLEVGDRLESRGKTVSEHDVVSFAALTGQRHQKHVDASWASESNFGDRVAQGALVISYALALLPIERGMVLGLHSIDSAELKRPVRLGDTIRVQALVREKQPQRDDHGLVRLLLRILNHSDELVAPAMITLRWRREPGRVDSTSDLPDLDDPPPTQGGRHRR